MYIMKKRIFILFFGLFCCFISNAQIKLVFDELRIAPLIYIHTAKEYYDSITESYIEVQLNCEHEEPLFGFEFTIENNTDKYFLLDTSDYDVFATFEVNNKQCKAWVYWFNQNKIITPFSKVKASLIAPHLFNYIREDETNKRIELPYNKLKDRNDYSNIIYSILPTFRMVYKEKDLELISDSPNRVIITKYSQSNLEHLRDALEDESDWDELEDLKE